MTQPIRITALDVTEEQVWQRHLDIERRLNTMGEQVVKARLSLDGFPQEWRLVIEAWLRGERLAESEKPKEKSVHIGTPSKPKSEHARRAEEFLRWRKGGKHGV
jgi:hypothetical protein